MMQIINMHHDEYLKSILTYLLIHMYSNFKLDAFLLRLSKGQASQGNYFGTTSHLL